MGTRQLLRDLARPRTLRRLADIGVLGPRRLLAAATCLPRLLRSGPSLAVLAGIHARSRGRAAAVVDRHGTLTWAELDERIDRLAGGWRTLDVGRDTRVAMLLRNGREFTEVLLAAQRSGAVAAPLNTWGPGRELGGILERERPPVLVYDTRHADQLEGVVPEGTSLVHVGDDADALAGSVSYERLLSGPRRRPPRVGWNTPRVLVHTSGTTGVPKAAARSTGLEGAASLLGVLDLVPYRSDDVMYVPNPLFHALGLLMAVVGLATGATMVLPDRFDPRRALGDLEDHGITAASFVPVMLRRMLSLEDPPAVDTSALRILLVSGAALPEELRRRAVERFGEVVYDLYGSTEAGWVAIATPETMRRAPGAVGHPVPGVQLALLDEDGTPVERGEGEIHVRGPGTFEGYASGEDTEGRAGYLSTGDLGHLDDDGYLHVVGRADDMAVVGGENVYPDEVEGVIDELDGVDDCAVVGVDDEEMGQVLVAFVLGSAGEQAVVDHCRDRLPSYKVPRRVHPVDELPRTATGKVIRDELSEPTTRSGTSA